MKSIAHLRHLRIAPRKVRMVADLVRGKPVEQAQRTLLFAVKKGTHPLLKLLNSAVANAKQKFQGEASNLYIAKLLVNEGPKLKRFRPRARGQTYPIQRKTSHITIVLEEREPKKTDVKADTVPVLSKTGTVSAVTPASVKAPAQKETPSWKEQREQSIGQKTIRRLPKIFRRKAI